jgi:hypothetical protein
MFRPKWPSSSKNLVLVETAVLMEAYLSTTLGIHAPAALIPGKVPPVPTGYHNHDNNHHHQH